MPRIHNTIIIRENPRAVFNIINDIERWPVLFNEYHGARVLEREDVGRYTKLLFELTNAEGNTWCSTRLIDNQELIATAERSAPLYPFLFMHLKWSCEEVPEGTRMIWIQDFELDPTYDVPVAIAVERMNAHTRENQENIKEKIETGVAV